MEQIYNKFQEALTEKLEKCKGKSIKTYKTCLTFDLIDYKSPEKMWEEINNKMKENAFSYKLNHYEKLTALISLIDKGLHKEYLKFRKEKLDPITQQNNKKREVKKINNDEKQLEKYFWKSMYKDIAPLRSDYSNVKLKNYNKETDNYFEDGKIFFNNLIKVKRNKVLVKELTPFQIDYINKLANNQEFLYMTDAKDIPNAFQKYLKSMDISINESRRQYVCNFVNELEKLDLTFIEKLKRMTNTAEQMNSSVNVLCDYYFSNNYIEE